jgi:hypothetical protein
MAGIVIEIPNDAYNRAVDLLDPKQLRQALFQTIKRTTNKGTRIVQDEVQEYLNISSKYVKRAVKTQIEPRDPAPPIGIIRISRRGLPLIAYKPSVTKRGGVTAKVWKDRPPLRFSHGFKGTVNYQNATTDAELHTGVFIRTRHASRGNKEAHKLTPKGFAGRLAIKQLMGPSVEGAVELTKVSNAVYVGLQGEAEKQLQSQIDRFTK